MIILKLVKDSELICMSHPPLCFLDLPLLMIPMNQSHYVITTVNQKTLKLHTRFCDLHPPALSEKRNLTLQIINVPAVDL